jgi:hypothetical protein
MRHVWPEGTEFKRLILGRWSWYRPSIPGRSPRPIDVGGRNLLSGQMNLQGRATVTPSPPRGRFPVVAGFMTEADAGAGGAEMSRLRHLHPRA